MADHVPQRVVIAGGHGQIALILTELLEDHGDQVVSLLRNPDHHEQIRAKGAEPVHLDLEHATLEDVVPILKGADAIVFAAGAGAGSELSRKDAVDRGAAVLLADAAEAAGVRRFIQISFIRTAEDIPGLANEVFAAFVGAKKAAEDNLRARKSLDWTIVRSSKLTDDEPTGTVTLSMDGEAALAHGPMTRSDVAHVVVELLDAEGVAGKTINVVEGGTPILAAVRGLAPR